MRNLKRALSLGLAAVMVMGMMIVGTSAKSYTDSDKIENQVAVEVLGEIGAMVGNEDGSFAPDRVVTRAEMAVLLTRILYGNNLNVDQFKGLNTFTDVPDWAEGFINLCASLGIVAGRGDGIFDPNATVTTAEASLMLSRALGYFKNPAEFGGDWALAAVKRATQANIIGGDMVLQANAGLTRDDVAQMTFNTLTKAVPVQYNELLDVYYNENQGIIYALEFNYLQTLGYTNFGLVYKTDESTIYGRPATTWGIGSYNADGQGTASGIEKAQLTDEGGLIASRVRMLDKDQIITVANTPDYVYSDATDEKDVYADLGATVCNGTKDADYTWTVYKNGEEQNLTEDEMIPSKSSTDTYEPTGKGSVTEIYIDDYDQTVTVVEINYYLGQVSKVNEDDKTITVKELSTEPKLDDDTFATTEFAEDDYVVFTVDYNDEDDFYICELMAPETVTGEVSRVEYNANDKANDNNNNYIRLDGEDTKYYYTAASHLCYDVSEDGKDVHPNLNEEYILYMTPAGYVLGFAPTEVTVDQYLYVKDSDEELRDWVARVVLPDATNPKVDLKDTLKETSGNVNYIDESTGTMVSTATPYGSSIEWISNKDDGNNNRTNIDNRVWKYSVNDSGAYTLTWVKNEVLGAPMVNGDFTAEIKNGKSYIISGGSDDSVNRLIVDQKTIFVDTMNDVAYTGYDAVPNVDNALLACVVNDDLVADIVFILDGDIYDVNATYFVLADTQRDSAKDGDAGNYWIYENSYVDGEKAQLKITYEAVSDLASTQGYAVDSNGELLPGVLYKATKTIQDGEFISALEAISYESAEWKDTNYFGMVSKNYNGSNIIGEAVGDNAFWITNAQNKTVKFDTDNDTVYVTVRRLVDLKGNVEYVVDDGKISDLKMIEPDNKYDYSTKQVHVVKRVDDNTARLVYIFWTETEKGDAKTITFNGDNFTVASASTTTSVTGNVATVADKGMDAKFTISVPDNYTLDSVMLGDEQLKADANGVYTIANVTKDMTVTVKVSEKTEKATLTLNEALGTLANIDVYDENGVLIPPTTSGLFNKIYDLKANDQVIVAFGGSNANKGVFAGSEYVGTTDANGRLTLTVDASMTLDQIAAVYSIHTGTGVTLQNVLNGSSATVTPVAKSADGSVWYVKASDNAQQFQVMTEAAKAVFLTNSASDVVYTSSNPNATGMTPGVLSNINNSSAISGNVYLNAAASVTTTSLSNSTITADGQAVGNGEWVKVGETVTTALNATDGTGVIATTATKTDVVSATSDVSYEMTEENVTLNAAWKVNLNGITSIKLNTTGETVTDGMYVVSGKDLDIDGSGSVVFAAGSPKHILDTTSGKDYGTTAKTTDVTVSADVELSAATELKLGTSSSFIIGVYDAISDDVVGKQTESGSGVTMYVVPGLTVEVTGTGVKIAVTTPGEQIDGTVIDSPNNPNWMRYVVGAIDVTFDD